MVYTAEYLQSRLIVWDRGEARELYSNGFFGKPLGIAKPKGADFDKPLVLDLIEGYYLAEKGKLIVYNGDRKLTLAELKKECESQHSNFEIKYRVYRGLRDGGFVALPGVKFGCDFAVYKRGPGLEHAPYIIQVVSPNSTVDSTYLVLSGRLATTVRKNFIIAVSYDRPKLLGFEWWRP